MSIKGNVHERQTVRSTTFIPIPPISTLNSCTFLNRFVRLLSYPIMSSSTNVSDASDGLVQAPRPRTTSPTATTRSHSTLSYIDLPADAITLHRGASSEDHVPTSPIDPTGPSSVGTSSPLADTRYLSDALPAAEPTSATIAVGSPSTVAGGHLSTTDEGDVASSAPSNQVSQAATHPTISVAVQTRSLLTKRGPPSHLLSYITLCRR